MVKTKFKNVWVTSEEKMQLASNIAALGFLPEDKGELEINSAFLKYEGQKQVWRISNIMDFSPHHFKPTKHIQWAISIFLILISAVALLNFILTIWFLTSSNNSLSVSLTIMSWVTGISLLTVVIFAWIVHLSSLGPLGTSQWIRVDYLDEKNESHRLYFADASKIGWGGKLGGTQKIHSAFQQEFALTEINNKLS